jgi:hypothetical protein
MGMRCRCWMSRGQASRGRAPAVSSKRGSPRTGRSIPLPTHFRMNGIKLFSVPSSGKFGGGVPTSVPEDCLVSARGTYPR